jgi:hypothetical protein
MMRPPLPPWGGSVQAVQTGKFSILANTAARSG